MNGTRILTENSKLINKGNTFSFKNIYSELGERTEYPIILYDRMIYTNSGNDWGWRPRDNDFIFSFTYIDINDETINNIDNFTQCLSERPFIRLNFFVGGRGVFEVVTSWVFEFVASYAAGKMLDALLSKISGEKNANNWHKIEEAIGKSGKIKIKLGQDEFGERFLLIEDVPIALKSLDETSILNILNSVKNYPNSFIYDKSGLHKIDDTRGSVINTNV